MDKFNEMAKDIDNKRMAVKDKDVLELNRQKIVERYQKS